MPGGRRGGAIWLLLLMVGVERGRRAWAREMWFVMRVLTAEDCRDPLGREEGGAGGPGQAARVDGVGGVSGDDSGGEDQVGS